MASQPLGCVLRGVPADLATLVDECLHERVCHVRSKLGIGRVVINFCRSRFSPCLYGQVFLNAIHRLLPLESGIWFSCIAMNPSRPEMLMRSGALHQIELVDYELNHLAALQNLHL